MTQDSKIGIAKPKQLSQIERMKTKLTSSERFEIELERRWERRERADEKRAIAREAKEERAERHVGILQKADGKRYYCSLPEAWPHKQFESMSKCIDYIIRRGFVR